MKWLVIICAIVAAAAGGVWYFKHGNNNAPQYEASPVTRSDLTQVVTATGTLNPVVNVTVGSQVSGRITRLNVDFNSVVKSNEVIAEIDPSTYEAQLSQVEADLANAKANLELQQANMQRAEKLYTNNLIAGSDYDTAVATRDEAAAQVQIQQASVTNAIADLGYCKILSPVNSVVISRAVDLGQTVASSFSTPTLFQIANDLTKMQIDTSVAEADVGGVLEGQDVDFLVDAYPNRTFHGSRHPGAQRRDNRQQRRHLRLRHRRDQRGLQVEAGHDGECLHHHRPTSKCTDHSEWRAAVPAAGNAVMLTNSAAVQPATATNGENSAANQGGRRGGGRGRGERPVFHTVYVLSGTNADAKLQAVQIKTGISDGISTEVVSGLDEGAQVVTGLVSTGTPDRPRLRVQWRGGGGGGGGGGRMR